MQIIRYILWGLLVVAIGVSVYLFLAGNLNFSAIKQGNTEKLGGKFTLTRANGNPITDKDLLGKPHIIFFGFTHCPDVCPTTLSEMSGWIDELGEDAERIGFYFLSVDPQRDDVALLSEYLSSFDPRIIGITGAKTNVEKVLHSFKVYSKRVELGDGDYSMNHTAAIYLLNSEGEFVGTIAYEEDASSAIGKLRKLLN